MIADSAPPVHYEQVYIRHLDGHVKDEEDECTDEEMEFLAGITFQRWKMANEV